jgi:DNA-binding GntR family transcriptional regulator
MSVPRNARVTSLRRSGPRRLRPVKIKGQATTDDSFHNTSRAEYVYQHLRQAIKDGQFQQGDRIREDDVAKSLGVSRTPVREALRRLQARGLLDFGSGRGLGIVELSRTQVLELCAMRELLEGSAARLAAQHATSTEVGYMRHLLAQFRGTKDLQQFVAINRRFHDAIRDAAHNRYMLRALNDLNEAAALLRGTTLSIPGRPETADIEHRAILDAIEKGDPNLAEIEARAHIRMAQSLRMQMIESVL